MKIRKIIKKIAGKLPLISGIISERDNLREENIRIKNDLISKETDSVVSSELANIKMQLGYINYKLTEDMQGYLSTVALHQKTFIEFKNINMNKDVVLVATGPTLNKYKVIEGAVHVGVNRSFLFDNIKLDYLFMQDFAAVQNIIAESVGYTGNNCVKFYGILRNNPKGKLIPESYVVNANGRRYKTDYPYYPSRFVVDISSQSLGDFCSVVFPAIQFILWTNPKRIYLVGCDCSQEGYFNDGQKTKLQTQTIIDGWKDLKEFAEYNYPATEIFSINPVGLKGIFKDISN